MSKSTEDPIQIYEGLEEILDNVRAIIRINATRTVARHIIGKINNYEDSLLGLRKNELSFTLEQK